MRSPHPEHFAIGRRNCTSTPDSRWYIGNVKGMSRSAPQPGQRRFGVSGSRLGIRQLLADGSPPYQLGDHRAVRQVPSAICRTNERFASCATYLLNPLLMLENTLFTCLPTVDRMTITTIAMSTRMSAYSTM